MAKKRQAEAKKIPDVSNAPTIEADQKHETIIRANINRKIVVSPTALSIYTNDVQVQTTPWDVRLILGEIAEVSADGAAVTIRQLGDVRLSLPLTKRLTLILIQQLKAFEERFGQIPMPPD